MPPDNFKCTRCGHCCTNLRGGYCFSPGQDEVDMWEEEMPHVLDWVYSSGYGFYDAWINPTTGEEVNRCPWYRFYKHKRYKNKGASCLIHKNKPDVCKNFPHGLSHALSGGCPSFDHLSEQERLHLIRGDLIVWLKSFLESKETGFSKKTG